MAEGVDNTTNISLKDIREHMNKEAPLGAHQPEDGETEKKFLPVCTDPREYLQILRETGEYRNTVIHRFISAKKAWQKISRGKEDYIDSPSEEDVKVAFEDGESFKQLFWNFYEDVLHLSYEAKRYSPKLRQIFEEYRLAAKRELLTFNAGKNKEEMIKADRERSEKHDQVAEVLVQEGIAETKYIARILTRAFLVDLGEDWISSARVADQQRVLRNLNDSKSVANFLSMVELQARAERFSPERQSLIQEEYLKKQPKASFVEKGRFQQMPRLSIGAQGDQENLSK